MREPETGATVLVVDDDPSHRLMLRALLGGKGYRVEEAPDGADAITLARRTPYDLILMDVRMAGVGGIDALKEIRRINPAIPIIIMTAYSSVDTAVEALKSGAYDYLTKPLDPDEMLITMEKALDHRSLQEENIQLRERLGERLDLGRLIGRSPSMKQVFETLALVAPTDATVLITGESGTGKELVAGAIHHNSPRSSRHFITVNCAAITETLLESELFGHERGAFTGAVGRRDGRFLQADGGTVFLDEIGEMAPAMQAKLLRVLQDGEIQRVGSDEILRVDVRTIAATNRDLAQDVQAGRFREDLYYRLNVVNIHIPPLRDRREDIPLLARHFLDDYARKNRRTVKGFTPRAVDLMSRYSWPGNVRELENAVERGVILMRGEYFTHEDLPLALKELLPREEKDFSFPPGTSIRRMEKELVLQTLEATGGNKSEAARRLGITRRTLFLKLKEYASEESGEEGEPTI
ncbi:MAG: sigma-54-dependent Fis family transcriptional regulator [Deltaproteobacteria bacterium]|nr:sigma-54-dependent Fis family transcriptional regulator [Deltaproteobacteria bacterium]